MAESSDPGVRYKGKVTIVTGGGRGIGKGCVEIFVSHGSKVVIAEIREDLGVQVERTVNQKGPGEATFVKCDITNEDDVKNMVNMTMSKYGRIDCVINNAGTAMFSAIDECSAEAFRKMMDVNVIGTFIVSKYALPYLRKVKGNIVNMASVTGMMGTRSEPAYAATKSALMGFTKTLAIDEAVNGVRVNAVAPGPIHTQLFDDCLTVFKDGGKVNKFFSEQCTVLGRWGKPGEIGMACLYLAADATFSTGAILPATGGADLDYGIKRGLQDIFLLKE